MTEKVQRTKLPYLKLYIGDLRKDRAYTSLSTDARLVWLEMLFIMHDAEPRGYLDMTPDEISRAISVPKKIVLRSLAEMERVGTFSKTDEGTIFNRRMVRETELSGIRAEAGKAGAVAASLHRQKGSKILDLPQQTSEKQSGKKEPFTDNDHDSDLGVDFSSEKQVPNSTPETPLALLNSRSKLEEIFGIFIALGKGVSFSDQQFCTNRWDGYTLTQQMKAHRCAVESLPEWQMRETHLIPMPVNYFKYDQWQRHTPRLIPQTAPKSRTQANQDKAAAEFITEERRAGR